MQISKWKAPQNFRSAGFIYPGSYLLSRDLSSDKTPDGCKGGSRWGFSSAAARQS